MDRISVVTPTLNRPAPLARALTSLMAQQDLAGLDLEIIVVDNSPDANARETVVTFGEISPFPVLYIGEPRPGVANARNAGVSAANGRWIAFLDDDEQADAKWLANLMRVARSSKADAVFGPVSARADEGAEIGEFAPFFERRIERADGAEITDLAAYLGTNNSLFDRASCFVSSQNFDPDLNESGGEDSLFLQRLVMTGKRFSFARDAKVVEWAPPRRLTWAYVKKRKFLSGQIRVFVQDMAMPRDRLTLISWMAVGLAQTILYGLATLMLVPFGESRRERMAAKAFGGLGKIFWSRRFRLALYGRGLVS
jgi:glycosyltransferase involved in cell wall biosynthesis